METQTRFDLNASVESWRAEVAAQSGLTVDMQRELETHLRDSIAEMRQRGLNEEESFRQARERTGQLRLIGKEFKKIGISYWNKPLAVVAWMIFVISLFMPVYDGLRGYECVLWILPVHKIVGLVTNGKLEFITMELLNYTILLMVASPFLLGGFGKSAKAMKWVGRAAFAAMILAGWFILFEFVHYYGKVDIMPFDPGCFVWASSFVALYLSIVLGLKNSTAKKNPQIPKCA